MRQLQFSFANPAGVSQSIQVRVRPQLPGESSRQFELMVRAARSRINQVIAQKLADITRSNFGPSGLMRPKEWPPYSRRYAKKHPGPPTLVRTGVLMGSIRSSATAQYGIVTAEGARNYAAAHQFGYAPNNLSSRPFFPARGTGASYEITESAQREVQRVVDYEVQKIFDRKS